MQIIFKNFLGLILLLSLSCNTWAETIVVDGKSPGRIFDGVGVFEHGGMARLLYDYPEPQRSQILDYMFKPKFGMSWSTILIELPTDMFMGWGTLPSHIRSRDELDHPNCNRDYYWWLMDEAKKRNPKITFDAILLGTPAWIGDQLKLEGDPYTNPITRFQRFFSSDCHTFIIKYLECAKSRGLNIDFLTIWGELPYLDPTIGQTAEDYQKNYPGVKPWDPEIAVKWLIQLKKEMIRHGFSTKLIPVNGFDWKLFIKQVEKNEEFRNAIDVMGATYASTSDEETKKLSALWGKPLWAVNQNAAGVMIYSTPPYPSRIIGEWLGASVLANLLNVTYLDGQITKMNVDGLVTAFYDSLYLPGFGQMTADAPWSGHYVVQPGVWSVAHTTQFAEAGWQYVDSALTRLSEGGTVVALKHDKNYSVIAETKDSTKSQSVTFCVKNGLSTDKVYVWRSTKKDQFIMIDTMSPDKNGCYTVILEPDALYSITTTTGQKKGSDGNIPELTLFPFPYSDDFDSYDLSKILVPKYLSTQEGAFEFESGTGASGNCLKQTITQLPLGWMQDHDNGMPYTLAGDRDWTDYKVSVRAAFVDGQGTLSLLGRIQGGMTKTPGLMAETEGPDCDFAPRSSYRLTLSPDGTCVLERTGPVGIVLRGVSKSWPCRPSKPFGTDYHKLELICDGLTVEGFIDGKSVIKIEDTDAESYSHGMVGLATSWNQARFDDIKVEAIKTSVVRIDDSGESKGRNKFKYEGKGWKNLKDSGKTMFGRSCRISNGVGDTAIFNFSGRRVRYVASKGPNNGLAAVSVDGGAETLVDLYAIEDKGSQVVWVSPVLKAGSHTLKIRVTDKRNPGIPEGDHATVDAVDVIP